MLKSRKALSLWRASCKVLLLVLTHLRPPRNRCFVHLSAHYTERRTFDIPSLGQKVCMYMPLPFPFSGVGRSVILFNNITRCHQLPNSRCLLSFRSFFFDLTRLVYCFEGIVIVIRDTITQQNMTMLQKA